MQDPSEREVGELLELASDVKDRLRRLEAAQATHGADDHVDSGALLRARNHLELALEALGAPTWGFAAPAGSLKITGFYSSEIYKALRDLRNAPGKGRSPQRKSPAERSGPVLSKDEAEAPAEPAVEPAAEETLAPAPPAPADAAPVGGESGSKWVKSRVDEIQRALTAAFGEDELLPDLESPPKPFAQPEFIGNTDVLSVPELIGFFQLQGKTGVLTIDARDEQVKLEYLRGELIHAASSRSPEGQRLGDILVDMGHLSREGLDELLADKAAAERLGDTIRRGELVPEAALAQALETQVQNIFHRLFDVGGCRFTFREGLEGEPRARVRYNVTRLLLETARVRDEQRQAG